MGSPSSNTLLKPVSELSADQIAALSTEKDVLDAKKQLMEVAHRSRKHSLQRCFLLLRRGGGNGAPGEPMADTVGRTTLCVNMLSSPSSSSDSYCCSDSCSDSCCSSDSTHGMLGAAACSACRSTQHCAGSIGGSALVARICCCRGGFCANQATPSTTPVALPPPIDGVAEYTPSSPRLATDAIQGQAFAGGGVAF